MTYELRDAHGRVAGVTDNRAEAIAAAEKGNVTYVVEHIDNCALVFCSCSKPLVWQMPVV